MAFGSGLSPVTPSVEPVALQNPLVVTEMTRAAIQAALDVGGHIQLDSRSQPVTIPIDQTLTIKHPNTVIDGGGLVTLDGQNQVKILDKVFTDVDHTITLQNLRFINGRAPASSNLRTNSGGAVTISDPGTRLQIINSTFENNQTTSVNEEDNKGGAIAVFNIHETIISGSAFRNNQAGNGGAVGGLATGLIIENTSFENNHAVDNSTGGIVRGRGGAVHLDGVRNNYNPNSNNTVRVRGSSFEGNTAIRGGGAVASVVSDGYNTNVTYETSSFLHNEVLGLDGNGQGGAIYHVEDDHTGGRNEENFHIVNSTFHGNLVRKQGGGVWVYILGKGLVANSTFEGNSTTAPLNEVGQGGAMAITLGNFEITNATFANNHAAYQAGAIHGGGANNADRTITLANSIFLNNTLNEQDLPSETRYQGYHTNRRFQDGGNNIQFPRYKPTYNNDINNWITDNPIFTDPQLGPLQDNGGATLTMLPAATSPVIDAGEPTVLPPDVTDLDGDGDTTEPIPYDQRGRNFNRVLQAAPDIGAVETGQTPTSKVTIAEYGVLNLDHDLQTINLSNTYNSPVVFAAPVSYNGSDPAIIRLDNITGSSFDAFIQEANYDDGIHITEQFSYFVFEQGLWQLEDGTIIEVGTQNSTGLVTSGFDTINFSTSFGATPAVFSQIQTFNGSDFVRTRQRNTTPTSVQIGMEEEEANKNSGHTTETLGWLAMSPGSGTWDSNPYTVGTTTDSYTDSFQNLAFSGFSQAPQFLGSIASYDGIDPSGLRYRNLTSSGIGLKIEEDTSADTETTHTTESLSYLALEGEGILTAEAFTGEVMAEYGTLSLNHITQTVDLINSYTNPVVFAAPVSYNGADPAIVRFDNITGNSFDAFIQEANYLDGIHATEQVSYFVMEAGTWQLDDGTIIEVGTQNSDGLVTSGFDTINFSASFGTTPTVFSQVQTFNGSDFVRTRQQNPSPTGVQVGMEEEELLNSGNHITETLGWLAMSSGSGTWDGNAYAVGTTGYSYTNNFSNLSLSGFSQTPKFLGNIASYDGIDPSGLRYQNLTSTGVSLKVEEDQSLDSELTHTTESLSYFALEGSGLLTAVGI